jgi:hypothetical protein
LDEYQKERKQKARERDEKNQQNIEKQLTKRRKKTGT